jgi:hypothetical protein
MKTICLFACLFIIVNTNAQRIFINELMASNDTTIADANGNYDDWFEIYNKGVNNFSLKNCYVTNDQGKPTLYQFTGNITIPAHGFIIIWASGDTSGGNTHVPFKLSASGAGIYLYKRDGATLLDSVSFGPQKTDISYGRLTNGSSSWRYFNHATPGASNNTSTGYLGVLSDLTFSQPGGFYANAFNLDITSPDQDVQIIYTLDGSMPDNNNLQGTVYRYKQQYQQFPNDPSYPFFVDSFHSNIYTNPVQIKNVSNNPNHLSIKASTFNQTPNYFPKTVVNKGMMVRAIAVKPGYLSSNISTAIYFVTAGGTNKYTLPVLSLAMQESDLYSWDSGVYVAGIDFENWRATHPKDTAIDRVPGNYRRDSTERYAALEMFEANGIRDVFNVKNGAGIHGGGSRAKPLKSMTMYLRSKYGTSDLDYQVFPDLPYKDYKRLILRNSGSEWASTHFRDMAIQQAVRHLDCEIEDGRPGILFINGEYWGIENLREDYGWHYFNQHYGIEEDELDYLEKNAIPDEGDNTDYLSLRNYISDNDLTSPTVYDSVTRRIDINNYIDYYSTEIFYANTDWPQNNINYYRKRIKYDPNQPAGLDGRYRWVFHDLDACLGLVPSFGGVTNNTLATATGTNPGGANANPKTWATVIFKQLTTNPTFKQEFITRYADLMNTSFLPDYPISVITHFHDLIAPEMPEHIARWRNPANISVWESRVNGLDTFIVQRMPYARQHLRNYFSLSAEKKLTVNVSDTSAGYVRVNTIDITPSFPGVPQKAYPWSGFYYPEVPVTLVAKAKPGYKFSHWSNGSTSKQDTLIVTLSKAKIFKANFVKDKNIPVVIHYWHFNNLPEDSTFVVIRSDSSLIAKGKSVIRFNGSGDGYMDASDDDEGSDINAQFNQPSGKSLRARNPAATRKLRINVPTTNYKDIVLSYATARTSKGAQYQSVYYTVDGKKWQLKQDSIPVPDPETNFALETFDFSSIDEVNNNPDFAIKIIFFGSLASGSSGNDRFDNISISGIKIKSSLAAQNISQPVKADIGPANQLLIIPNPVKNVAAIKFYNALNEQVSLKITSTNGQLIKTVYFNATKGNNMYSLNVQNISSGIYMLTLQTSTTLKTTRFIKE